MERPIGLLGDFELRVDGLILLPSDRFTGCCITIGTSSLSRCHSFTIFIVLTTTTTTIHIDIFGVLFSQHVLVHQAKS